MYFKIADQPICNSHGIYLYYLPTCLLTASPTDTPQIDRSDYFVMTVTVSRLPLDWVLAPIHHGHSPTPPFRTRGSSKYTQVLTLYGFVIEPKETFCSI